MDKQVNWSDLIFGAGAGAGMLAYLMEKINKKREFRRENMNVRDCCVWTLIGMRPYLITIPQDEAKEQICAYYQVIDKFISKTEAYKRLIKSVPDHIEDKNAAVMDIFVYSDFSLVDETVLVMIACSSTLLKDVLDENSDFIGECYKFAELFISQMKSREIHQQRLKEMENEYNKQKQQKECSLEEQIKSFNEFIQGNKDKCESDEKIESVDEKNKSE